MRQEHIGDVIELLSLGEPFLLPRTASDYWLYAKLFSSTCPLAFVNDQLAGAVFAFRSQDDPAYLYVQDVMVHPDHRRRGIASALLASVADQGRTWGCKRLYLTSEPGNDVAHRAWLARGFTNIPGDLKINNVHVHANYKGPGRNRAVYERRICFRQVE